MNRKKAASIPLKGLLKDRVFDPIVALTEDLKFEISGNIAVENPMRTAEVEQARQTSANKIRQAQRFLEYKTDNGRVYFVDLATQTSSWVLPDGGILVDDYNTHLKEFKFVNLRVNLLHYFFTMKIAHYTSILD